MHSSVLHIDNAQSLEQIKTAIIRNDYKYIHFSIGESENIIETARHNDDVKQKLILLSNAGFHVYVHRGNTSSLVHYKEIKNLWIPVKDNTYSISSDNIVYFFKRASCKINEKLLVVFSQMPLKPYAASLHRYFAKNFSTIDKYVGNNVSILRVADVGGITGAFYLNTICVPDNVERIIRLLSYIRNECCIKHEDVVLYGCSKGGTASLYYGLAEGFNLISVDPILNDDYYVSHKKDLHLIEGIFPEKKHVLFNNVIQSYLEKNNDLSINIITSQNSEQYPYIMDIINPILNFSTVANSCNSNIKTHPDVGPNSIHMITSMINMALSGVKLSKGLFDFI